ncbi:MAG: hypothetical protein AAGU27_24855 [Dehalobacterium sp.]
MADIDHFRATLQAEADRISFERAKQMEKERYEAVKNEEKPCENIIDCHRRRVRRFRACAVPDGRCVIPLAEAIRTLFDGLCVRGGNYADEYAGLLAGAGMKGGTMSRTRNERHERRRARWAMAGVLGVVLLLPVNLACLVLALEAAAW